jgi:hypothetical protein
MDPDQTNSLSGNITRGLAQVRDALSRESELEEGSRVARAVRRHRGVIVLTTIVGAFWLCIAGGVRAASSHDAPFAALTLAADHEAPFAAAAAVPGPIEWPTIAIAPKKKIEKPKKKH